MIGVAFNNFGFERLPEAAQYASEGIAGWVRAAGDLGFSRFQYTIYGEQDPNRFAEIDTVMLRKQLEQSQVTMSLHHHAFDLLTLYHFSERDAYSRQFVAFVRAALDFVNAAGGDLVTIHPPQINAGRDPNGGYASTETRKKAATAFREALHELGDHASSLKMRLGIEAICFSDPFPGGTAFRGIDELDEFLRGGDFPDSVGVQVDTTHYHHKGISLDEPLQRWKDCLFDLHVSDSIVHQWKDAEAYREKMLAEVHLPVGAGTTDFTGLVQTLKEINYDGWLTMEIYPRHVRTVEDLIESRLALEGLLDGWIRPSYASGPLIK